MCVCTGSDLCVKLRRVMCVRGGMGMGGVHVQGCSGMDIGCVIG